MAIHKRLRDKYNVQNEGELMAILYRDSVSHMQEYANKGFANISQEEVSDYRKDLATMITQAFGIDPIAVLEERRRKIQQEIEKEDAEDEHQSTTE